MPNTIVPAAPAVPSGGLIASPAQSVNSSNVVVVPSSVGTNASTYLPTSAYVCNDWWFDVTGYTSTSTAIWTAWNTNYTDMVVAAQALRRATSRAERELRVPYQPDRGTLRMQEIETAKTRAEGLLREHLSERQREDLAAKGYFDVCAVDFRAGTRRYYRIKRGRAQNVFLLDGPHGREVKRLCCHPHEQVPDADTMLAQKLMLEMNEELFLKLANITDLATGRFTRGQGLQAYG